MPANSLPKSNWQSLVYFGAFVLLWFSVTQVSPIIGVFIALLSGLATFVTLQKLNRVSEIAWWKAVFVGLLLAEVFFALTFWSTLGRNKALILLAVMFVFGQWFDRIEVRWLIVFLLILLGALLLVPFQVL